MRFDFSDDDLDPAIATRQSLQEKRTNEELQKLVFLPIRKFLRKIAEESPRQIVGFFGEPFNFPKKPGCVCQDIYLLNTNRQVMYLGTVYNTEAIEQYPETFPDLFTREDLELWRTEKRKKIVKGQFYHDIIIRSETKNIDVAVLTNALKQYFNSFKSTRESIPRLAESRICWFSPELGRKLDERIIRAVMARIKEFSSEEFRKKFNKNEL